MNNETWRDVVGYEGCYEVSTNGRVRSLDRPVNSKNGSTAIKKGKVLKQTPCHKGYLTVNLSKNGKSRATEVQRIVAKSFIDNPDNLPCVNHRDENKTNNTVKNLEWCTYDYNNHYGTRLERSAKSHTNGKNSKAVTQYTLDGELVAYYPSCAEVRRIHGYDASKISECCRDLRKTAYGFKWKYEEV